MGKEDLENQIKVGDYLLSLDDKDKHPFYKVMNLVEDKDKMVWVKMMKIETGAATDSPLLYVQEAFVTVKASTMEVLFGNKLKK